MINVGRYCLTILASRIRNGLSRRFIEPCATRVGGLEDALMSSDTASSAASRAGRIESMNCVASGAGPGG